MTINDNQFYGYFVGFIIPININVNTIVNLQFISVGV